ncbi:MFS transporter [Micromonospora sp. LOL_024]|uniref:MFS transporter n=1 Tax=Micromonospora sp. LOL_024 TaxID=3345412 RepID=UPI003A85EABD
MRIGSMVRPLKVRPFALLLSAQLFSNSGDSLFFVTLVYAMTIDRGSGTDLAIVLSVRSAMILVTIVFGGVIADRMRRTRLMAAADTLRGAVMLGLVFVDPQAGLWLWVTLTILVGCGASMFRPAHSAVVPALLGDEHLESGNALRVLVNRIASIAAPALGAVIVAVGGTAPAFAVGAVVYFASLLTLLGVADPALPKPGRPGLVVREAFDGVQAVWQRKWLLAMLSSGTLQLALVVAPTTIMLPTVLADRGQGALFGGLMAARSVGFVVGTVLAAGWRPRLVGVASVVGSMTLLAQLACFLTPVPLWVFVLCMIVAGAGPGLFIVYWPTALQRAVPDDQRGRVFAVDEMGVLAFEPIGLALTPVAMDALGVTTLTVCAGVVLVVTSVAPLAVPGVATLSNPEPTTFPPDRNPPMLDSAPGVTPRQTTEG